MEELTGPRNTSFKVSGSWIKNLKVGTAPIPKYDNFSCGCLYRFVFLDREHGVTFILVCIK